ncbi:YopX family protein [Mycobacteroides abscessus]|uniref:YopX family protein n=1 Tax=Mycobacteroides abscessus TaxID=36809 RepID=UPI0012FFF736
MREIKFRFFRTKAKEMVYGFKHCSLTYVLDLWEEEKHVSEPMQFTGLTTKNGQEIYEGDIVLLDFGVFGPVYYDEAETSYVIHIKPTGPGLESNYEILGLANPESVIGNIFENPELVKGLEV